MTELKGSKTEQNLKDAFAGESQARNKYTYFASVAKKEGYEQIAAIFQETADQEKEHAKLHLKLLEGIGDAAANLKEAAGARTTSGPVCTPAWQRPPDKKILRRSLVCSTAWRRSRRSTRSGTRDSWRTSGPAGFSPSPSV
jgi:rubrerythrin